ncbi:MAG: hypothetical protein D6791_04590 [Chloroflexi bacterium]|nr:MAG: hypothetical protein D6791_04590 [Chloroflexota bacterium]
MLARIRQFFAREEGSSLPYFALFVVVLVGFAAISLDGSTAYLLRRQMQNAADAAAVAGARHLAYGDSEYVIDNRVKQLATMNGAEDVVWDYTEDGQGIWVQTQASYDTGFARLFGVDELVAQAEAEARFGAVTQTGNLLPMTVTCEERDFGETYLLAELDSASNCDCDLDKDKTKDEKDKDDDGDKKKDKTEDDDDDNDGKKNHEDDDDDNDGIKDDKEDHDNDNDGIKDGEDDDDDNDGIKDKYDHDKDGDGIPDDKDDDDDNDGIKDKDDPDKKKEHDHDNDDDGIKDDEDDDDDNDGIKDDKDDDRDGDGIKNEIDDDDDNDGIKDKDEKDQDNDGLKDDEDDDDDNDGIKDDKDDDDDNDGIPDEEDGDDDNNGKKDKDEEAEKDKKADEESKNEDEEEPCVSACDWDDETMWDSEKEAPGNFGWLDWNGGSHGVPELIDDIEDPSRSGEWKIGDWVPGRPGIKNGSGVRAAIDKWVGKHVTIPLYDEVTGNGSNTEYHICGFGEFIITDYDFTGNSKWIKGQFIQYLKEPAEIGPGPNYGLMSITLSK